MKEATKTNQKTLAHRWKIGPPFLFPVSYHPRPPGVLICDSKDVIFMGSMINYS